MEFQCEVHLSEKDYLHFNRDATEKLFTISGIIVLVIITAAVYDTTRAFLFSVMMALPVPIITELVLLVIQVIQVKATYKSNKLIKNTTHILINEHGIQENSSDHNAEILYENVYKVCESKHGVYIYFAKNQAVVIPKRVLENQDREKLYQLLRGNLAASKVKLRRQKRT